MLQPTHEEINRPGGKAQRAGPLVRGHAVALLLAAGLLLLPLHPRPAAAGDTPCDCGTCHGEIHGPGWTGCSGCHDSPPATGSHRVHYDDDPQLIMRYGDTTISSTDDAYRFGCGNCHPLDKSKHRDGTVEIELYDATAPAESLKEKNPATAAYNSGTGECSDVYCHSGYTVTSGAVGLPLTYPSSPVPPGYLLNTIGNPPTSYIMDETCSNLTYAPYTWTYERVYKTTPPWGTYETFTTCWECHDFPLTTNYPTVEAGVGDSHQWMAEDGWSYRHGWNHGFGPVPCRTCHYETVTADGDRSYGAWDIAIYGPLPISSRATHVNGAPNVAFDTVNGFRYYNPWWGTDITYYFTGASYDPATKSCSDVDCHYKPTSPKLKWQQVARWGVPQRWNDIECDACHRMGLNEICEPAP